MSLVNDVLRNLETSPLTERMGQADFARFSTVYKSEDKATIPYVRWVLLLVLAVMAAALLHRYMQPVPVVITEKPIEIPAVINNEALMMDTEDPTKPLDPIEAEVLQPAVATEIASVLKAKSEPVWQQDTVNPVVVMPAEIIPEENQLANSANVEAKEEKTESVESYNRIARVESGEEYYQLALAAFNKQRYSQALSWLKQAIAVKNAEHFIALKARVLIVMKDAAGFRAWQQQNSQLNSTEWLQLIAAGYQKLGNLQASNTFYKALAKAEPEVYQWSLAMAINYQRQDNTAEAVQLYQTLRANPQLNTKQRQWVIQQLRHLQAGQQGNS